MSAESAMRLALKALQEAEQARVTSRCTAAWAVTYRRKVEPLVEAAIQSLKEELHEANRTGP